MATVQESIQKLYYLRKNNINSQNKCLNAELILLFARHSLFNDYF
jgi:hypothetical protein